jgi:DNA-binding HxlR family transcriptional regulator
MELAKVTKRAYDDACATAHAMDLIGERWALMVMRELMLGPKRFGDLRASLPGISANVLTQRLEGLEAASILIRRKLPPPASAWVYELSEWGYESAPLFRVLGQWAARSPGHDASRPMGAISVLLSFDAMIDAERAAGLDMRIAFRFGAESFVGTIRDGGFTVVREDIAQADFTVTGDPRALAGAVYGGQPIAALEAAGVLAIEGDRAALARFVTLFPLPAPAPKLID